MWRLASGANGIKPLIIFSYFFREKIDNQMDEQNDFKNWTRQSRPRPLSARHGPRDTRKEPAKTDLSSDTELLEELESVTEVWEAVQGTRDRNAIYQYLKAVYRLVRSWEKQGFSMAAAQRALQLVGSDRDLKNEPFSIVILATSEVDFRMRSKWSRALRYAREAKLRKQSLGAFIRRAGGINACASQFARRRAWQS